MDAIIFDCFSNPNAARIEAVTLTGNDRETSVDGVHPSDMGYTRWARTIEKPLLRILKKYGIR